jgi:hypothetical protein
MGFRKDYLDVGAKPAAEKVRSAVRSARDAGPPHKHQQSPCSISVHSLLQLERSTRLSGQEEAAQTEERASVMARTESAAGRTTSSWVAPQHTERVSRALR